MAKGDINVDLIPDAMIEPPSSVHPSNPALPSGISSMSSSSHTGQDMSKLMAPGGSASMPNYMSFMSAATGGLPLPFSVPSTDMLSHPSFEDPFFKKYMSDLASNIAPRSDSVPPPPSSHTVQRQSVSPPISAHSTPKLSHSSNKPPATLNFSTTSNRPVDAHKLKSPMPLPPHSTDDAPLDLSKPVDLSKPTRPPGLEHNKTEQMLKSSRHVHLEQMDRSYDLDRQRKFVNHDDSISETYSEMADSEMMNDVCSSPPSPQGTNNANNFRNISNTPGSANKRYRTQMSATQVSVCQPFISSFLNIKCMCWGEGG